MRGEANELEGGTFQHPILPLANIEISPQSAIELRLVVRLHRSPPIPSHYQLTMFPTPPAVPTPILPTWADEFQD